MSKAEVISGKRLVVDEASQRRKGTWATFSHDGSTFFYADPEGFFNAFHDGTVHFPWRFAV